jgi:hypothetical protein
MLRRLLDVGEGEFALGSGDVLDLIETRHCVSNVPGVG